MFRRPGGLVAVLGAGLSLAVGCLLLIAGGVWVLASVHHLWAEIGPVYRDRSLNSRLDFSWFYYGMQTAWQHADPVHRLYSITAQDRWMAARGFAYDHADLFGYPPPFALLWASLAALPYTAARQLWTLCNIVALGVGIVAAAWQAGGRRHLAVFLLLCGLALWAEPLQGNFYWGQPNSITLALVAMAVWGATGRRPAARWAAAGGVAAGLATVFKLTPVILLVYWPVRAAVTWALGARSRGPGAAQARARARAAAVAAAAGWATVAAAATASGFVLGWPTLVTYVHSTIGAVEQSAWAHGPAPWNQALHGILMIWSHNQHRLTVRSDAFGIGVFALAIAAVAWRPRLDARLEAALASLLVLLPSPSLEDHHFTVAILPWLLVVGYLLDRLRRWPQLWAWPLAALALVGSVALVAPGQLHWPPPGVSRGASVAVPAGHYSTAYLLGAATYGPVAFDLRLRYRQGRPGVVRANWPDWWSPNDPLPPVIAGVAEQGGTVNNASVGLYGFAYPTDPSRTLTALHLPGGLPQQNGGPEGLHVVALTLRQAGPAGGFVAVSLPFNARGLAPSAAFRVLTALSLDGVGNAFWTPAWPSSPLLVGLAGAKVPFSLPDNRAALNVWNVPGPPLALPGPLAILARRAPDFLAIALFFVVSLLAAALEGDDGRAGGRPAQAGEPALPLGRGQ